MRGGSGTYLYMGPWPALSLAVTDSHGGGGGGGRRERGGKEDGGKEMWPMCTANEARCVVA